jgi:hypothetical protein
MHLKHFGDSYDVVKQSLLRWMRDFGEWSVHPMFTEAVSSAESSAFGAMLGVKVLSNEVLNKNTDRLKYFACAKSCGNLLLDPDTGLRMKSIGGSKAPHFLFAEELVWLSASRPESLTMVFDQALSRGSVGPHLEKKLELLCRQNLSVFAYVSHACFIFASTNGQQIARARQRIIEESRLPESRFLSAYIAR